MRTSIVLLMPLLIGTAACNARDEGNGTTVISVDENKVDQGLDVAGNAAAVAANKAGSALENAVPALENTADTIGERAGRVADKAENAAENVDVDLTADNKAEQNR